jgi:hypothetical protein
MAADIEKRRSEWFGHVIRMDKKMAIKKILEVNEKVEENKKVRIEMTEMETIIHEG